jgi:hypothetical protein
MTGAAETGHKWMRPAKMSSSFAVEQRLSGLVVYAVMALPRNTQSKTVVKMKSGKSAFAGERSSQRNCLSNSSLSRRVIAGSPLIEVAARIVLGHIFNNRSANL